MNVETHGEHLLKATRFKLVNAYLVREEDGFTLVDTMVTGSADGLLEAARNAGAPIVRVVLTHGHNDHTGSVDALAGKLPDAQFVWSAREARFLRGDKSLDPGEPQSRTLGMVKVDRRPDREVVPGDRIGSLEVHAAPGHTPGQIALLDVRDRTLIAGDAYHTVNGTTVISKINPLFALPTLVSWDRPTALRTGRELRDLAPTRLAVGHGRVVEDATAEMERAVAAAGG